MTTPYVCGVPIYDLSVEKPLKRLYALCKCGKKFETHLAKDEHKYEPELADN